MVQISEVKGNTRENRTAAHTHIKGLGLRSDGYAETTGAGFVGQIAAREVCAHLCYDPRSGRDKATDVLAFLLGMRCGGRPHKVEENVRTCSLISRRARNRQNSLGPCCIARARNESTFLPNSGKRNLLDRGKENGGADGELSKSNRLVLSEYRRHTQPDRV